MDLGVAGLVGGAVNGLFNIGATVATNNANKQISQQNSSKRYYRP